MSVKIYLVISDKSNFCIEKTAMVQDTTIGLIDLINQSSKEALKEYKSTFKEKLITWTT